MGYRTALLILLFPEDKRPPIVKVVSRRRIESDAARTEIRHGEAKGNRASLRRKMKRETRKIKKGRGKDAAARARHRKVSGWFNQSIPLGPRSYEDGEGGGNK